MKALTCALTWMVCALAGVAQAQIYADFTVSHGGASLGTFRVQLHYDKAPRTCANFIGLATGQRAWLDTTTGRVVTGQKYYDGLTFHRLIHNFMIQGGDPRGNGSGGPGYVFQDEFHPELRHDGRYMLSMANSGTCSNGSQFFITLEDSSWLDDKHSVFGEVISGKSIIDGFTDGSSFPTGSNDLPSSAIVMDSVVISGPDLAGFDIFAPSLLLPTVNGVNATVAYDPGAGTYDLTWDRKAQTEYLPAYSFDLSSWLFTSSPYLLSLDQQANYRYRVNNITSEQFYSQLAEVNYSTMPAAPADLAGNSKTMTLDISDSEVLTMVFDGAGGGTWSVTGGASGDLTSVTWNDSAPVSGIYFGVASQAKYIPQGGLQITFDQPVGSESWYSLNVSISFHTGTSGWCDGSFEVPQFPPVPGGSSTMTQNKRVPFTYTP